SAAIVPVSVSCSGAGASVTSASGSLTGAGGGFVVTPSLDFLQPAATTRARSETDVQKARMVRLRCTPSATGCVAATGSYMPVPVREAHNLSELLRVVAKRVGELRQSDAQVDPGVQRGDARAGQIGLGVDELDRGRA